MGALLGGPLSDWVGRRAALVTGALLVASGTIIQCNRFMAGSNASYRLFIYLFFTGCYWLGGFGLVLEMGEH